MPKSLRNSDTEKDNAQSLVRKAAEEAARYQGGTELTSADGSKGNEDKIDLDRDEPGSSNAWITPREKYGNDH